MGTTLFISTSTGDHSARVIASYNSSLASQPIQLESSVVGFHHRLVSPLFYFLIQGIISISITLSEKSVSRKHEKKFLVYSTLELDIHSIIITSQKVWTGWNLETERRRIRGWWLRASNEGILSFGSESWQCLKWTTGPSKRQTGPHTYNHLWSNHMDHLLIGIPNMINRK